MQNGGRCSSQMLGNVLDGPRSQRHSCSPLLPTQWPLRRLLGGPPSGDCLLISPTFMSRTLTLVAIHILGINVTGVSVNPARSFGPAVLVEGTALAQVWMFLIVPSVGGIASGVLYRARILGLEP